MSSPHLRSAYPDIAEAVAPEDDQRAFIARFWKEQMVSPIPEGMAGEEIGEGVTLGYLDSTVADCIQTFVSGSAPLDQERLRVLTAAWSDLDEASDSFNEVTNVYFHRLWKIVDLTLAFHNLDPFAHLRGGPQTEVAGMGRNLLKTRPRRSTYVPRTLVHSRPLRPPPSLRRRGILHLSRTRSCRSVR